MFPVNPLAVIAPVVGHGNPLIANNSAPVERRRRARVRVHWPIVLFPNQPGEDVVATVTQNLSSQGFYCLSRKRFTLDELLLCTLQIPMTGPGGTEGQLECRARVVRVEDAADGEYGIACRLEDYRFVAAGD